MTSTLFAYHDLGAFTPVDLASSSAEEQKKIHSDFFPYAAYIYMGLQEGVRYHGVENGLLIGSRYTELHKLNSKVKDLVNTIINQITALGFNIDPAGNFYSLETGTAFNLILDRAKNEIIFAYMGLNTHTKLEISDDEKEKLRESSYTAARLDFFGDRTAAVEQVYALGAALLETTKDQSGYKKQFKPVFIGHSHGGGLAQVGGLAHGIKTVTFNPRPIGKATMEMIGADNIRENQTKISTFCIKGDWLSETQSFFNRAARVGLFLTRSSNPRNFGIPYCLPESEENSSHSGFYNALRLLQP